MEGKATILLDYEQKKVLFDSMVIDGIQFLDSSMVKLKMAHLELCSLRNIKKGIKESFFQWKSELIEKGSVSNFPESRFDYFGNKISDEIALFKVASSSFYYLHSFFDNYAQFLNTTLLANQAMDRNCVSIKMLANHLRQKDIYNEILDMIDNCLSDPMYQFIEDYNNVTKHQINIFVDSRLYLNDGDLKTNIPGFDKKRKSDIVTHLSNDLETKIYNSYEFTRNFCIDTTQKVYEILKNHQHLYTKNRYHSVNARIQLPNPNKNVMKAAEVYIVTDNQVKQGEKYYFLFCKNDDEDISLNNSTYKSIIIKNSDNEIIGMLTADDPGILDDSIDRVILFQYRSYTANIDNYSSIFIDHLKNTDKISVGYGDITVISVPDDN